MIISFDDEVVRRKDRFSLVPILGWSALVVGAFPKSDIWFLPRQCCLFPGNVVMPHICKVKAIFFQCMLLISTQRMMMISGSDCTRCYIRIPNLNLAGLTQTDSTYNGNFLVITQRMIEMSGSDVTHYCDTYTSAKLAVYH